jgi:hypothetical protein
VKVGIQSVNEPYVAMGNLDEGTVLEDAMSFATWLDVRASQEIRPNGCS